MAAVSRANAEKLMRPLDLIRLGTRIGEDAYAVCASRTTPANPVPKVAAPSGATSADVSELLAGHRPGRDYGDVQQAQNKIDVIDKYDIIVVGGGTAGASAAIGAARKGARVLVVEMLGMLGGTGANGIGRYWKGVRNGFTDEISGSSWKSSAMYHRFFTLLDKAGGDIYFSTLACGIVKSGTNIQGVVIATPMGRYAVTADVVIDASGDGDAAVAAGAQHVYVNDGDLAVQEDSYLGDGETDPSNYVNEFGSIFSDPIDIYSMTQYHVLNRKYGQRRSSFEFYPLAGIRESRLIIGDYVVTALDQYVKRPYPDIIGIYSSDYDMHGYFNSAESYAALFPDGLNAVPYRSLLVKGLNGMMVVGRCKSVTHDALPLSRMQSDVRNEGYAAGYAAALSVQSGVDLRSVNIKAVQDHLVSIGSISASHMASYRGDLGAPTDAELSAAVNNLSDPKSMALVMRGGEAAETKLRASMAASPDNLKAMVLCMMGDKTAVDWLANWLSNTPLGQGTSYSYTLRSVKRIDGIIWALGIAGSSKATGALAKKLNECGTASSDFSHIRALASAIGATGDGQAAPALVSFLNKAGVKGHVTKAGDKDAHTKSIMLKSIIEIHLAAALYRCGDSNGMGKQILTDYVENDWRGTLVRYAATVLGVNTSGAVIFDTPQPAKKAAENVIRFNVSAGRMDIEYFLRDGARLVDAEVYDMRGRRIWRTQPGAGGNDAVYGKILWNGKTAANSVPGNQPLIMKFRTTKETVVRKSVSVK
jgi:hypothetical protein